MPRKAGTVRRTARYNGRQYEGLGATEREATEKLAEKLAAAKRGELAVGGDMTVNAWFRKWKALYKDPKGLTPKSLKMYEEKYNGYIGPRIGHMKLRDVRDVHLQEILNGEAGKSTSHVQKLVIVIRAIFRKARRSRLIVFDPSEDLELPATVQGKRRSITEVERQAILEVAKTHPAGLWVLTLLYTGMRPGETAALTWDDIDFEAQEIHIHAAKESGSRTMKGPKTDAGVRVVPLRAALLPVLLESSTGKAPSSYVFLNRNGNRHDDASLGRLWRSFKRALDIHMGATVYRNQITHSVVAPDLVPYCLRHTFCTDLQDGGVPINIAKELMGHEDIQTTSRVYTHRNEKTLHGYIRRLDTPAGSSGGSSSDPPKTP